VRIAVSSIAWAAEEAEAALDALVAGGAQGVEIAPTTIWPGWDGATVAAAREVRARLAGRGLAVPALQSVLFGRAELQVFGDAAPLVAHVARVAGLAGALGAGVMVFGSPRNRLRGEMGAEAAMERAVPVFRALGEVCAAEGTALGIEANPAAYGGDFLLRWREAAELVARVGHPGVVLHLDTACTALAGDDPAEAAAACGAGLAHFHVSAPQLAAVEAGNPIDHAAVAAALRAAGYGGWVSVEMRRSEPAVAAVARALDFVRGCYA